MSPEGLKTWSRKLRRACPSPAPMPLGHALILPTVALPQPGWVSHWMGRCLTELLLLFICLKWESFLLRILFQSMSIRRWSSGLNHPRYPGVIFICDLHISGKWGQPWALTGMNLREPEVFQVGHIWTSGISRATHHLSNFGSSSYWNIDHRFIES